MYGFELAMRSVLHLFFPLVYFSITIGQSKSDVAWVDMKNKKMFFNANIFQFFPELQDKVEEWQLLIALLVHEIGHVLFTIPIPEGYVLKDVPQQLQQAGLRFLQRFFNAGEDNYIEKPLGFKFPGFINDILVLLRTTYFGPKQCAELDAKFGVMPMQQWLLNYTLLAAGNSDYRFLNNPLGYDWLDRLRFAVTLNNNELRQATLLELGEEAFRFILAQSQEEEQNEEPGDSKSSESSESSESSGSSESSSPSDSSDKSNNNQPQESQEGQQSEESKMESLAEALEKALESISEMSNVEIRNADDMPELADSSSIESAVGSSELLDALKNRAYLSKGSGFYQDYPEDFSAELTTKMRKLMSNNRPGYVRDLKRGNVDLSRMTKIVDNPTTIFMKRQPADPALDFAFSILLDVSSSTGSPYAVYDCIYAEITAFVGTAKVFNALNVAYQALLFSSQYTVLKEFHEDMDATRNAMTDRELRYAMNGTDLESVLVVAEAALKRRREAVKVMIILTDGAPSKKEEVRKKIDRLLADGVLVVTLIFGGSRNRFVPIFGETVQLFAGVQEFNDAYPSIITDLLLSHAIQTKPKKRR